MDLLEQTRESHHSVVSFNLQCHATFLFFSSFAQIVQYQLNPNQIQKHTC